MSPRRSASAFVKVLVALTVVVITVGLLLSAVCGVRHAAARVSCANHLKQLGIAAINKCETDGHFVPGTIPEIAFPPDRRLSFYAALLPYLEWTSVYTELAPAEEWDSPTNAAAGKGEYIAQQLFQCPEWREERGKSTPDTPKPSSQWHFAYTNFIGVAGLGVDAPTLPANDPRAGVFGYDRALRREEVKDGLANTALILETGRDVGPWMQGGPSTVRGLDPSETPFISDGRAFGGTHVPDGYTFRGKKPSRSNLLLADASIRYLLDEADPVILAGLATVAGGEPIPADW